jgi:hypothetical protein
MDQENSIYLKAIDMSHLLIEKQKNNWQS